MARYKVVDLSPRFLPVVLDDQLVPGTFAHAVHHLVDGLDLADFDAHYRNDANGAPAHSPSMLLKAVLPGYSQAIVSSRSIEAATASAHKLARLVYTMISRGEQYVDQGQSLLRTTTPRSRHPQPHASRPTTGNDAG
jgi:hypothetical protein